MPWPYAALLVLAIVPAWGADVADGYAIRVRQTDASAFPHVSCIVTVTDAAGAAVAGLTANEFSLAENDLPVRGHQCQQRRAEKLAVALIIDRSGSMSGESLKAAKDAATGFVGRMGPSDLCAVLSFASSSGGRATFSADNSLAARQIASLRAGGWTALYDAVFQGVQRLKTVAAERKAIVALSDGRDNRSSHSLVQAIASAKANGIEVYTIGTGEADKSSLGRLANETGGLSLYSASAQDLLSSYRRIFGAITTTYQLAFDTPNEKAEPALRTLAVSFRSGPHSAGTRVTYNVPSGSSGEAGGSILDDLLGTLLVAAAGANLLLLVAVLIRRRSGRHLALGG